MIVIDTIFVFPNESFSYTLQNEINLEKTISYLPAVYLKNRFPSSMNLNYRGLLFNQVGIYINNFEVNDPQTGHHNFNIPLNSLDLPYVKLRNFLTLSTIGYSEKPKINFELGQNKGKLFSLIETKIKNLSLGYYNNFENGHYYQIASHIGEYGFFGFRRNDFDATGFFAPPKILPFAYETTTVFLGIINYKQIGFLLRTHHDVFVYDYKRDDTTIIKNLKNEHFSLKSQFKYVLNYKNSIWELSYKRDFLSSNIVQRSLNKQFVFRDFLKLNSHIYLRNINFSIGFEYLINNKSYLITPNLDIKYKNLIFSISTFSRYPDFTELYYRDPANVGNPNLKPEFYLCPEISYQNHFVIIKTFYRYNYNLIDWVYNNDSLKFYAQNLSPIHSFGFEAFTKEFYKTQVGIAFFKYISQENLNSKYLDNTPQLKFSILSRFISLNVIYNEKLDEKLRPILDIHIKYKFAVLGVDDILEKNYINDWIKPSRKIYVKFLLDF
jgi:iron complex outermembrane receptor protein